MTRTGQRQFLVAYDNIHYRHNIQLYHNLAPLAKYFQITKLNVWLTDNLRKVYVRVKDQLTLTKTNALALGDVIV